MYSPSLTRLPAPSQMDHAGADFTGDSPHDGAHVPGQVPAAGGGGEVLLRVEPVGVDHEVPVGQVSAGRSRRTEVRWTATTPTKAAVACAITYISGVLDLFLPLKNSGKALLSISWMLRGKISWTTLKHTREVIFAVLTSCSQTTRCSWE